MKPEGAASSRRPAAVLLLAVLALAAGGLVFSRLARIEAETPAERLPSMLAAAGLPGCEDPVSVAWPPDQERLGCRDRIALLVRDAVEATACTNPERQGGELAEVEFPLPGVGDRLRVSRASDGSCVFAVEMLPGSALLALGLPIDLNRASALDLEALGEIGPHRARAVIADRETQGAFPSVDALTRVSGIGPATLAAVRSKLTVAKQPATGEDEGLREVESVEGMKR